MEKIVTIEMLNTIKIFTTLVFASVFLASADAQSAGTPLSPVRIGFIAPLTGPFAKWGESLQRGAELAMEDVDGRIAFEFQDDGCEAVRAVSIAERFFSVDGFTYLLGPGCDHCLKALLPIAKRKGALVFSTGLLDDAIFDENGNVINLATQISEEARRLIIHLSSTQVKRLSVVHGTNSFGEEFARQFELSGMERKLVTKTFATPLGTSDFRAILPQVLSDKPDLVFIHQGEAETLAFLRQLRALAPTLRIAGPYNVETEAFARASEADNLEYAYPLNTSLGSKEKTDFDKRYAAKYGDSAVPSASTYYVYDGVLLLDKALQQCERRTIECVNDYFRKLGSVHGLSGDMTFLKNGSNARPYGIKAIRKGKFVWLDNNRKDP